MESPNVVGPVSALIGGRSSPNIVGYRNMSRSMEVWREFNADRAERLVERLVARRRAPGENAVATICFGEPANLTPPPTVSRVLHVNWPDTPENQLPADPAPLEYNEVWRDVENIRVENPDDADQYVTVQRIKKIRFQGPDGREHQFNLDWTNN